MTWQLCGYGNWHKPTYYSPYSVFNRPIGPSDTLAADQSQAQHVANQIQYGRAGHTFFGYTGVGYGHYQWPYSVGFNFDQFTFPLYCVDNTTPTQKVGLWNPGSPNQPFGLEYGDIQQFYNAVPIPDKTLCPRITGTGNYVDLWTGLENGFVVWNRDTDEAWEFYGASNTGPADMQSAMGCTWLARGAGYIPSMTHFSGCFATRWGARGTSLGAVGGLITMQDLRDVANGGGINHALCFGMAMNGGSTPFSGVPPATRSDGPGPNGNNVATIPAGYPGAGGPNPAYQHDVSFEGGRFRFPANVDLSAITTPVGLAIATAIRDYGMILVDTSGAAGFYVEDTRTMGSPYHLQGASAVDPFANGNPLEPASLGGNGHTVLIEPPWDQLQVLTPVGGPPPTPPEVFTGTFWDTPLPDNATIDPNSAAAVAELAAQSRAAKPNLNVWSWTAAHIYVTSATPRVPVTCASGDSHLNAMFAAGVPIPAGTQPTTDSDSALAIVCTDTGEYWEMQGAHLISGAWHCNFGGKQTNVFGVRQGHYVNYTSGPAGTYELNSWGTQGSGLPYWPGEITPADLDRGYCDHALLLEVIDALKGSHVWPAVARSDGGLASSNLIEGQRYRLAPNYPVPAGAHPIGQCVIRTLSLHGCFITDRTANNLCMRATPDCGSYLGSTADYDVLDAVPWGDLQLLVAGSDSVPVPVA